jgi:hypothetical protein
MEPNAAQTPTIIAAAMLSRVANLRACMGFVRSSSGARTYTLLPASRSRFRQFLERIAGSICGRVRNRSAHEWFQCP